MLFSVLQQLLLYPLHFLCGVNNSSIQGTDETKLFSGRCLPPPDKYKWVAGIHRRLDVRGFQYVCGGTVISSQLVLSAAQCFWNNGSDIPLVDYRISAGNMHKYMDFDTYTQKREVKDVVLHERYHGKEINYAYDIAIVRLKDQFLLNDNVAPISIDWSNSFSDSKLEHQNGLEVGWGLTKSDEPSKTRIEVQILYVGFEVCYREVPREFRIFLTPDKFCAKIPEGVVVCPGNEGEGLAFLNTTDMKWYLRGIMSMNVVPKKKDKCNKTQYATFTSISEYNSWLKNKFKQLNNSIVL